MIDENGVHTDPKKNSAVACRGKPRNQTEVKSFLGLTGHYHEHIHGDGRTSSRSDEEEHSLVLDRSGTDHLFHIEGSYDK
jgi:hypothetical protein